MAWVISWNWSDWTDWSHRKKKTKQFVSAYIYRISIYIIVFFFFLLNFHAASHPHLWLYKLSKLVELALLGIYVAKTAKTKNDLQKIINFLLIGAVFQSLLAIFQFFKQASIGGIFWWLGERTFNITTPGIAKTALRNPFNGSQRLFLRPYGTFSHPNSLAGHLLVVLILTLGLTKTQKNKRLNPNVKIQSSNKQSLILANTRNKQSLISLRSNQAQSSKLKKKFSHLGVGFDLSFELCHLILPTAIILIALALSFSRSAWLVGIILLGISYLGHLRSLGKQKKSRFIPIFLILILYTIYYILYTCSISDPQNFQKRWQLTLSAWQMFKNNPFFGIGLGHFIPKLAQFPQKGQIFWLQPVHNIFLLVMAETGLAGLGIFLGVLGATYKRLVYGIGYMVYGIKGKKKTLKEYYILHTTYYILLSLSAILLLGLFDHYWLTLQQNQLLFALILGLCWTHFNSKA